MTEAATTPKPKKRGQPSNGAPVMSPAAPSNEEMMTLINSIPMEERMKILTNSKVRSALSSAFASIIASLASVGIIVNDPMLMLTDSDEDGEVGYAILADGSFEEASDDDDDDGEGDEGETETQGKAGRPPSLLKALKEMMKEENLSQADVASKLAVSQGSVSNWLNNGKEPKNGNRKKLTKLVRHYLP